MAFGGAALSPALAHDLDVGLPADPGGLAQHRAALVHGKGRLAGTRWMQPHPDAAKPRRLAGALGVRPVVARVPDPADEPHVALTGGALVMGIPGVRDRLGTIGAIGLTMESRDPYTAGHQQCVANLSVAIAAQMGWTEAEQQVVYLAGLVHDIGKIAVPSEILTKPSKLSALEMSLVRQHVEAGYQILKDIPFPWPIAEMVHQHHERLEIGRAHV